MSVDEIRGHDFDGIEEYDNKLPNWWLWTFFGACIFSVAYWIHFHVLETGPSSQQQYGAAMAAFDASSQKPLTDEGLIALSKDPKAVAEGKALFDDNAFCWTCHTKKAGGIQGLGVNLTDDHWKHDPKPLGLYATIAKGIPGTSMPAHEDTLGRTRITKLVAYLLTLQGTNVEGGLPPEGKPLSEWQ